VRDRPPVGAGWWHEVKFDGWRVQLAQEERGLPDFRALHFRYVSDDELCVWAC
jgi:hypothetical protein